MSQCLFEPRAHYRRFADEVGELCETLEQAKAAALEMMDACDPVHEDRSDMGASVWQVQGSATRCVWSCGFVQ